MKEIVNGIHTWSSFSEEKQIAFNGFYIRTGREIALVDPPAYEPGDLEQMQALGAPQMILITNVNHVRKSGELAQHFGIPIKIHQADAAGVDIAVATAFVDGDDLGGGLVAVQVPDSKSPGETAFHLAAAGVMIVGDALIGRPAGEVSLLPPQKFPDPVKARQGVKRLLDFPFETLLVGDGEPILSGGREAIQRFLDRQ